MTIRSTHEVLNDFALKHMQVVVPEDVDAMVNVAVVQMPEFCQHGDMIGTDTYAQVDLWAQMPSGGRGRKRPPAVAVTGHLPWWMVRDGDVEPIKGLLDHLWTEAQFLALVHPTMNSLHRVLEKFGPFPDCNQVPADDSDDDEV